ncbi:MAG: adenylate/guanylate cyclase domain-containing protein [Anaerolineae bacterium]|nr:adenylate/guanylate cyclase domain-containing protein [Anaerolineae bacterium]
MSDIKNRQLQLLLALDEARDSIDDSGNPMAMFRQIVRILKQHFNADGCAILLVDTKTRETEAISSIGIPQDMAEELAREALDYTKPKPLAASAWQYSLGLRILIDREKTVPGSIILVRDKEAFAIDAIELLEIAESQIDSAVIQARTIWRLAERNRELEAIYQIDRLRDDSADEDTLYVAFTSLMVKQFRADVCQFIIRDMETGKLRPRNVVDKRGLSEEQLASIISTTHDIQTTTKLEAPPSIDNMYLLASPFIVSGVRLGAVIIGRSKPYSVIETRLMVALTSQMDSAIAKSRTSLQLELRTRELEAIYRIDHIRDQENDFDEMLHQVLQELCQAVSCETGYIMLYNKQQEDALEIRASTREGIVNNSEHIEIIKRVSREALDTESVVTYNGLESSVHSIASTPLILNEQVIGVFGALNSSRPRGFTVDDGRMLAAITSQVDTAVFERLERRRMRKVLSRSVDPKVLDHLLKRADDSVLTGERVILTVLFADLRGSTEWTERTEPEEFVSVLNTFLGMMTDVIFKHGGTLDKFVGDEVIALFGSPIPMTDHALKASRAALEMQAVHERLQKQFAEQGKELPAMGVGISSGEVIAGEFGPPIRTDFTAMGRVMNLGARLCSAAAAKQIVISENTYAALESIADADKMNPVPLKGISRQVDTYLLKKLDE